MAATAHPIVIIILMREKKKNQFKHLSGSIEINVCKLNNETRRSHIGMLC